MLRDRHFSERPTLALIRHTDHARHVHSASVNT
jgi:hypothetical protein